MNLDAAGNNMHHLHELIEYYTLSLASHYDFLK